MEKERNFYNRASLSIARTAPSSEISDIRHSIKQEVNTLLSLSIGTIDINNHQALREMLQLLSRTNRAPSISEEEFIHHIRLCQKNGINNAIWLYRDSYLVGFGLCYLWGNWTSNDVDINPVRFDMRHVWYIKTVVVDAGLQGLNEGEIILKTLLKQAKEAGNTHILLHAVEGNINDPSYCFFRKHGAEVLNVRYKRWYQESLDRGWQCPRCGNPCECSSVEMLINLRKNYGEIF